MSDKIIYIEEDYSSVLKRFLKEKDIKFKIINKKFGNLYSMFKIKLFNERNIKNVFDLTNDIAIQTKSTNGVRIYKDLDKNNVIYIEIPNKYRKTIDLFDFMSENCLINKNKISFVLGRDINNKCIYSDFIKTPNLLITGRTNSGKSNFLNSILYSLLLEYSFNKLKFLLISPNNKELKNLSKLPYILYNKVIVTEKMVIKSLENIIKEIKNRDELFIRNKVNNLIEYNNLSNVDKLPHIVIIIDEFSNYICGNFKDDFVTFIKNILKMAQNVGIHLIMTTKYVYEDIITRDIIENFSSKISFHLSSKLDSKFFLGTSGSENLANFGEMLYQNKATLDKLTRLQTYFVTESDIQRLTHNLKKRI